MADSSAVVENLLAWRTDNSSVQTAVQANQRVAASVSSVSDAARQLGMNAEQIKVLNTQLNALVPGAGAMARIWNDDANAAMNYRVALQDLTVVEERAAVARKRQNTTSRVQLGERNIGTGFGTLRSAGAAISMLGGGSGVSQVASFVGLTATLGVAGAAAGITTIALKALTDAEEELAKKSQETADLINQIYGGAASATTESINQQIEEQTRLRDSLQEGQAFLQGLQGVADQHFGFVNISGESVRLSDLLKANQEDIDKATLSLAGFNVELGTNAVKANDAAAAADQLGVAEEKLAEVRAEASQRIASSQVGLANEAARAQTLTTEERRKEIVALEVQKSAIQAAIQTYFITGDAADQLKTQMDALDNQIAVLTDTTLSYADVQQRLAAQEEALTTQTDNYFDALEREGEIRDRITQTIEDKADLQLETGQKAIYNELDYQERIGDIEAEAGQRREEIAQDSADRVAKIEARAAYEQLGAIANRDALAFDQAKQRAQEQLTDQQKADAEQLERLDRNIDRQELTALRGWERQQRQIDDAYNRQLRTLERAHQQEQVDLTNAVFNEQQIALYGAGKQRTIHTQLWTDLNSIAVSWAFNTANTVRSILGSVLSGLGQGGASSSAYQIGYQAARDYVYTLNTGGRAMPS